LSRTHDAKLVPLLRLLTSGLASPWYFHLSQALEMGEVVNVLVAFAVIIFILRWIMSGEALDNVFESRSISAWSICQLYRAFMSDSTLW
jgi:hypothetical protein